ncbi:MAG: TonB C-terminal domain-containing protein [Desulfomonile tiedjei]|nr:TonB C-terminal domain-containing protein [Desulfomonile tiedjei]
MNRILVAAVCIVLAAALCASASEGLITTADQLVVDRSTRSKVVNDYTLLTRDAIQRAWTTPTNLTAPGALKGRVGINYTVRRDGSVESVQLVRGSGSPDMDRTLVEAIKSAGPFPAFPDDIQANKLVIMANFIVADVPTLPAVTADHEVATKPSAEAAPDQAQKKYIWGVPAGTANRKEPVPESAAVQNPAPAKKYRWGLER